MDFREQLFGIYDIKADAYIGVFVFNTKSQAMRMFSDVAADKSSVISKHPADYKMLKLGDFDPGSGCISPTVPAESLGFASDFLSAPE